MFAVARLAFDPLFLEQRIDVLDRVHAQHAGHLPGARAQRFGRVLVLGDLREQRAGFGPLVLIEIGMRDELARAGEIGLAGCRQRLERSDDRRAVHLVIFDDHLPQPREIAHGGGRIFVPRDLPEQGRGLLGVAALFGNPRAHHHRGDRGTAFLARQFFELGVTAVEIARLDLVERTDKSFGIAFHRGFLSAVPVQISCERCETEDEQREQRLAPAGEKGIGIALADRIVHLAQQRFLLGIGLLGALFFAGQFVLGCQGHWAGLHLERVCLRGSLRTGGYEGNGRHCLSPSA